MSLDPILWALKDAPVADSLERLVLVTLGERAARADGCTAFPSRDTLAATVLADPKTVQRVLQRLVKRGLIAKGDQSAARYIRADRRPVVYDLLIPYRWFPNPERMNAERRQAGLPPLTPEDRPDIAPPPARARRSDVGMPRKKKGAEERGDSESPRPSGCEGTDNPARGDYQSQRGDFESCTGGLSDPRTSSLIRPLNHPSEPLSPPPVPAQRTAGAAPAEREIVASIDRPSTAQQVVRAANILTSSDDETAFITWATARYRIRSGALWRTVAANGDLTDWVTAWRAEGSQAVAHSLTGTDATVMGWMALADQLREDGSPASRPSVTDQRVQAALDLGRRMQAEADAWRGSGYEPDPPAFEGLGYI